MPAVGSNVKILKGVAIGGNSLIGNGSFVVASIPPNVVAAGIPARIIREPRTHACAGLKVSFPRGDAEVDFRVILRALRASAGIPNVTSQAKQV